MASGGFIRRKETKVVLDPNEPITETATELAQQLKGMYSDLREGVGKLTHGDSVGEVVGDNLLGWLGTGRYKSDREHLCKEFSRSVELQMAKLQAVLPTAPPETAAAAVAVAAEVMLVPVDWNSNETEDLMRRAMAARIQPLLPYLERDLLQSYFDRLTKAYPKRMRFPAEREMLKTMEKLLNE